MAIDLVTISMGAETPCSPCIASTDRPGSGHYADGKRTYTDRIRIVEVSIDGYRSGSDL